MLASLIRINGLRETDVRRVVVADDALRTFDSDLRPERRWLGLVRRRVPAVVERFALEVLEPAFGIDAGTAALARVGVLAGQSLQWHTCLVIRARRKASL